MNASAQDAILHADRMHMNAMEAGSNAMLAAFRHGYGPVSFMWNVRATPATYTVGEIPCYQLRTAHERMTVIQQKEEFAETLRVSRDSCPWCAVRADIGCKHGRVG